MNEDERAKVYMHVCVSKTDIYFHQLDKGILPSSVRRRTTLLEM